MDKTKINFSHNLLGCRFDNWLRLKKENPITNKKQARFITGSDICHGDPGFFGVGYFPPGHRPDADQEGSVLYCGILAFRNDLPAEPADQGSASLRV